MKDIGIDWAQKKKSFKERNEGQNTLNSTVAHIVVFSRIRQLRGKNRVAITGTTQYFCFLCGDICLLRSS